jgi:hypothetical protein
VTVWQLDLQLSVLSVPITTQVVSSNPVHGEVYSIQYYVKMFASDLRQIGSFLRVHRFSSTIKTERDDITEILLKVALNIMVLIINIEWIWLCIPENNLQLQITKI